jgi:hypothetical protein
MGVSPVDKSVLQKVVAHTLPDRRKNREIPGAEISVAITI